MNDTYEFIIILLTVAVQAGTPILFAAIGEIYAERSGVLNLGLEGMMLVGAMSGYLISYYTKDPYLGLLTAVIAGALLSLIHAFLTITLGGSQIIAGLALNFLGAGLSSFLGKSIIGQPAPLIEEFKIPYLCDIPFFGNILFNQDLLVYLSYPLILVAALILFRSRLGLNIRSVGENPYCADSMGLNVSKIRYGCVVFGGAMAGLAGAYLSLIYADMWVENMVAGRGWIAIAVVIFSFWSPLRAVLGAYLFGGISAFTLRAQAIGLKVRPEILQMLPYIITIAVLIIAALYLHKTKKSLAPLYLGTPYRREERE